jgi:LysM repeat protein
MFFLAFLLGIVSISNAQFCSNYHVVRAGDTCYQLAMSRGLELNSLLQVNPGINCYNLQIGQTLCIPQTQISTGYSGYPYYPNYPNYQYFQYYNPYYQNTNTGFQNTNQGVVNPFVNPIINSNNNGVCYSYYTVRQGDICYNIARSANLQLYNLYTYNPGLNCDNLQIGQLICLNRI